MKTLFLVLGLVFITGISLFSATEQEIIAKLKEIDEAVMQGTISYKVTVFNERIGTITSARNLIYDSQGRYKSVVEINRIDDASRYMTTYIDDKYYFSTPINDKSVIIHYKKRIDDNLLFENQFHFGRGLTLLENLRIDPINNIATGNMSDGSTVKAYLDPNQNYAAYKLERNSRFSNLLYNNSIPVLADGKYYIFSKSTRTNTEYSQKIIEKIDYEIVSATFKAPDEKDYIFDWSKNTFENIVDTRGDRKNVVFVEYKKSELPEGITLDKLLKMTEKRASKQQNTYFGRQITPIIIVVVGALCLIALIVVMARKRNKKRNSSV